MTDDWSLKGKEVFDNWGGPSYLPGTIEMLRRKLIEDINHHTVECRKSNDQRTINPEVRCLIKNIINAYEQVSIGFVNRRFGVTP